MLWWWNTLHHSILQRFIQCSDGEIHYTTVHYNFPYINLLQLLTHYSIFFFPPALMKSYLFISALFIILPSSSSHFFKKEFNTVQLANQQRKVDNFNPLDCFKKQSYNLMSTKKNQKSTSGKLKCLLKAMSPTEVKKFLTEHKKLSELKDIESSSSCKSKKSKKNKKSKKSMCRFF